MTSVNDEIEMMAIGQALGERFRGGEVIELIGDVGAGKTTLVKGIGKGLLVEDDVQSPSFTISRVYAARADLELHHYDFYRLQDAGVTQYELGESIHNSNVVTVVEWADTVHNVLPKEHVVIQIKYTSSGHGRDIDIQTPQSNMYLQEAL